LNINIGQKYRFSTKSKKNFFEKETFRNNKGEKIIVESIYRVGFFYISPFDEQEKEKLESYILNDSKGLVRIDTFLGFEFDESWDECERDVFAESCLDLEMAKVLIQKTEENGIDWLMENEFYPDEIEYQAKLPLVLLKD